MGVSGVAGGVGGLVIVAGAEDLVCLRGCGVVKSSMVSWLSTTLGC